MKLQNAELTIPFLVYATFKILYTPFSQRSGYFKSTNYPSSFILNNPKCCLLLKCFLERHYLFIPMLQRQQQKRPFCASHNRNSLYSLKKASIPPRCSGLFKVRCSEAAWGPLVSVCASAALQEQLTLTHTGLTESSWLVCCSELEGFRIWSPRSKPWPTWINLGSTADSIHSNSLRDRGDCWHPIAKTPSKSPSFSRQQQNWQSGRKNKDIYPSHSFPFAKTVSLKCRSRSHTH